LGVNCEKITHFIHIPTESPQLSCIQENKNKEFKIIEYFFVDNGYRAEIGFCTNNDDRVWTDVFHPCGVND
tara:strand:- start:141 stop:353 length:213 start_codon:yes stop_codon:yes gene_type:complete